MTDRTPIVMFGAAGRVGRLILSLAAAAPERYEIAGAVEYTGHPLLGKPLSDWLPGAPEGITLTDEPPAEVPAGTVAIHFSSPEATLKHLAWSRRGGYAAVVGTTGLDAEQLAEARKAADTIALMVTPNTSRGVNVLFWLAEKAASLLGEEYDIEIIEIHHHHKKDAPSGTARGLAEAVLRARGGDYERDVRHGREGLVGARPKGELGMHAVRGGDVVGDHTLMLAGPGERLELIHRAHSREMFAQGALQAAAWLGRQQPGLHTMKEMLGLE